MEPIHLTLIQKIAIWAIPILFGITLHEVSHGYVASKFGDNTAKMMGRLTLNPFKHIDLVGTIIIPVILVATTGFIFGWAKPVPVNPNNLRNPKKHMAIVAAAGPISNLLMAIFWILIVKLSLWFINNQFHAGVVLFLMGQAGILINIILMVLNLIPIPPLDGSKVLVAVLPKPWDRAFERLTPYGLLILVALLLTGILAQIMQPMIQGVYEFLVIVFNLR